MGGAASRRDKRSSDGEPLTRLESDERFASITRDQWSALCPVACRIAVSESGFDDERLSSSLRALDKAIVDAELAASMRERSDRLDDEAWDAEDAGDDARYDVLFRRSRAASALAFALSGEPGEAIFEAAFALERPEDLTGRLSS